MKSKAIYFVDDEHKRNYKELLIRFPQAKEDTEYQSAVYILAVPMILGKVKKKLNTFKYPVDWIWRWEWKYKLSEMEDFKKAREEEIEKGKDFEIGYDLTGSMIRLGRLALHLWNGYEHFNLLDCLSVLDDQHYPVVNCAIDMRMGKYMDWGKHGAII